jgi:hypothetical protein
VRYSIQDSKTSYSWKLKLTLCHTNRWEGGQSLKIKIRRRNSKGLKLNLGTFDATMLLCVMKTGIQNEKSCYEESSQFLKVSRIAFFTFRQKNFSLAYQVRSE